jgi:hypothetical protein
MTRDVLLKRMRGGPLTHKLVPAGCHRNKLLKSGQKEKKFKFKNLE